MFYTFLKANQKADPTIEITKDDQSDYRVDTDIILSFRIAVHGKVTPDHPVTVTFYVDGISVGSMCGIVMSGGGRQLAWLKWRTPNTPQTVNITASISGGNGQAYFVDESSQVANIVDMNQNIPPEPVAKDPETGKPVQKPNGYIIPENVPVRAEKTAATGGEYWAWVSDGEGGGKWVDKGYWVFEWDGYSASLSIQKYEIVPDEKVPTSKKVYHTWEMGSGYGLNVNLKTLINTDGNPSESSYTGTQTVVTYPKFLYKDFWRFLEKISNGFELQHNKYSTYNNRVHFTPLWYPDGKYTTHTEIMDLWTPEGMLFRVASDTIDIKGTVFDDWTVVPADPYE